MNTQRRAEPGCTRKCKEACTPRVRPQKKTRLGQGGGVVWLVGGVEIENGKIFDCEVKVTIAVMLTYVKTVWFVYVRHICF